MKKALWTKLPRYRKTQVAKTMRPYRIRPRSKNMEVRMRQYRAQVKEFLNRPENRWCPVALKIMNRRSRTSQVHHQRGRLGTLLLDERFWLAVSAWGHEWIGLNPEKARINGWLCQRGDWCRKESNG